MAGRMILEDIEVLFCGYYGRMTEGYGNTFEKKLVSKEKENFRIEIVREFKEEEKMWGKLIHGDYYESISEKAGNFHIEDISQD